MMHEAKRPYIGITGMTTRQEAEELCAYARKIGYGKIGYGDGYTLMCGVITSSDHFTRGYLRGTKSPALKEVNTVLEAVEPWAFPVLHHHSMYQEGMVDEVERLLTLDGIYDQRICRAIQLNNTWPTVQRIDEIKQRFADLDIILPVTGRAQAAMSDQEIADKLGEYADMLDYVLLDPSGGVGKDYELHRICGLVKILSDSPFAVGVAGGLCAQNVGTQLSPVKESYAGRLSCDAEGKLRTRNNLYLDMDKSKAYLREAAKMLF